ncbi:hypothetical protein M0805_005362 [Coniferiporia weirii]|nr:hypothetical protein M0805_005362 [Coniferiporia weirii]
MGSDEPARPVPPPHHYHHDEQRNFEPEDLIEPQSRLYETFSASEGATPIPLVVRQELADEHEHGYEHEHELGDHRLHDDYADELGFTGSHSEHIARDQPVLIAASSARSDSTRSSGRGQRVTFIGDLSSHDHENLPLHRVPSSAARSLGSGDRLRPPPSSSTRRFNTYPRREPERTYRPRRSDPRDRGYEQQLPYMIFVDYGDGLEIGNEVDGFMLYEEYLATAHLRRPKDHTYFIIPGSTPVIFSDEEGRELYRVDAQKYNTPTLRRRRYIIQDEFGNELFSVYSRYKYNRDASSSYSGSSLGRGPPSDESRTDSSESSAPDILVMDENGQRIYDSRNRRIESGHPSARSRFASGLRDRDRADDNRPNYMFVDEYGQPVDKETYYPREFRSGSSSGSSDESYEHLPRRSQIIYI